MPALDWLRYIFGQSAAIRRVAENRAAFWTGIVLVLLTSIARNYDQTFIGEKLFLWLFGPLLFSLVSGAWMYAVVYGFARRGMSPLENDVERSSSRWPVFMALFWMTAPIAWLYAIPVERFLDSVTAARANVGLLAIVSIWRVLLMTRVMQVLTRAPFSLALIWVLFAASVEVLVLFFFGGQFTKAILAGMGGMRNSPEEEVLVRAMDAALFAFLLAPVTLVVALALRPNHSLTPLPIASFGRMQWGSLAMAAVFWITVAVYPQWQVANNVAVERLLRRPDPRAALDYLSAREPNHFAPSRVLPPKPFERSIFKELPACFGVVQPSDAPWVRSFLVRRLDEMFFHYDSRRNRHRDSQPITTERAVKGFQNGLQRYGPEPGALLLLLDGLSRVPEGRTWLRTNQFVMEALSAAAKDSLVRVRSDTASEAQQHLDWLNVSNRLREVSINSHPTAPTNATSSP